MYTQRLNDSTGPPKVSVVMNCLNCEKYLKEAIDSVYAQTYPNWEIIFWDNASTDRSTEIAQSYDNRLMYFRGPVTIPLGAARNKALEQTSGEFIAYLDCDDLWFPEKLEKQIPLFDDPEVGLVFSDAIIFNEMGESDRLYRKRPYYTGYCFSYLLCDYFLSIQTVVIRRSVLDTQEEWFDPRFNMIEEADLFRRIAYQWKLSMVKESLAKWRVHSASWTWKNPHLLPEETSLMLSKYNDIFPDFNSRFDKEIRILEREVSINNALSFMGSGDRRKARDFLSPFIFSSIKTFILFLMTVLPKGFISFVLKHRMIFPSINE